MTEKEQSVLGYLLNFQLTLQKAEEKDKQKILENWFCHSFNAIGLKTYKPNESSMFVADNYFCNLIACIYMDFEKSESMEESFQKLEKLALKQAEEIVAEMKKAFEQAQNKENPVEEK